MNDLSEADHRAIVAAVGEDDPGLDLVERAHRRRVLAEEVCRHVATRHGLQSYVVRTGPDDLRRHHHVVMARSHAAAALHDLGLSFAQVGTVLACERGAARRMALRWRDHKAGRLGSVSEAQAAEVDRFMADGMSQAEACDQVGVGITGYESRKVAMRGKHAEDR